MTINCGLESQAENLILEHCAACNSDGSKCLKKAVDDAGLVFEVDGDVVYVVRDGFRYGMIQSQGTDVSIRDSRWSKAELLAIAERMK